jgi:hypothetical protein
MRIVEGKERRRNCLTGGKGGREVGLGVAATWPQYDPAALQWKGNVRRRP